MSDHMLPIEIRGHLQQLGLLISVLRKVPADAILEEITYSDTLGPLLNPTAWMDTAGNVRVNERILRALRDFQKVIDEVLPRQAPQERSAQVEAR